MLDKLESELGHGIFGRVFKSQGIAIKVIKSIPKYTAAAIQEIRILKRLGHQHKCLINLKRHFEFKGHVCMTFEVLDVSLYDYLKIERFKGFNLSAVKDIGSQILSGLEFLHRMDIIHTDLKVSFSYIS